MKKEILNGVFLILSLIFTCVLGVKLLITTQPFNVTLVYVFSCFSSTTTINMIDKPKLVKYAITLYFLDCIATLICIYQHDMFLLLFIQFILTTTIFIYSLIGYLYVKDNKNI